MSVHLNHLLEELKARVARMSTLVYQIVETSVDALMHADAKLAQVAIDHDTRIDNEEVSVEKDRRDPGPPSARRRRFADRHQHHQGQQ